MIKVWKFIKKFKGWFIGIIIILIVVVPYIILYFYLRKNGKEITIFPEFKIINIKNEKEIDPKIAEDAIAKGKEILKRVGALD